MAHHKIRDKIGLTYHYIKELWRSCLINQGIKVCPYRRKGGIGLKIGTFQYRERIFPGVVMGEEVYDLSEPSSDKPGIFTLRDFLAKEDSLEKLEARKEKLIGSGIVYKLEKVSVLAPLLNPGKIICIGWNYLEHADEAESDLPVEPVFFNKFTTSIIGPGTPIVLPRVSQKVDYEAELDR